MPTGSEMEENSLGSSFWRGSYVYTWNTEISQPSNKIMLWKKNGEPFLVSKSTFHWHESSQRMFLSSRLQDPRNDRLPSRNSKDEKWLSDTAIHLPEAANPMASGVAKKTVMAEKMAKPPEAKWLGSCIEEQGLTGRMSAGRTWVISG